MPRCDPEQGNQRSGDAPGNHRGEWHAGSGNFERRDLAPFFAALFFPPGNETAALLSAFATYAAGFLVRPFGAIMLGRVGDLVGRKYTFLVTIMVMGTATFLVGLLPTFGPPTVPGIGTLAGIGWLAPILLVTLRLPQGLAAWW